MQYSISMSKVGNSFLTHSFTYTHGPGCENRKGKEKLIMNSFGSHVIAHNRIYQMKREDKIEKERTKIT